MKYLLVNGEILMQIAFIFQHKLYFRSLEMLSVNFDHMQIIHSTGSLLGESNVHKVINSWNTQFVVVLFFDTDTIFWIEILFWTVTLVKIPIPTSIFLNNAVNVWLNLFTNYGIK